MTGSSMARMLVIGIGNDDRGDDAVGLEIARRVRAKDLAGVTVELHRGELTSLMDSWQSRDTVVLIDAVHSNAAPGTLFRLDVRAGPLPALFGPKLSSHGLGVAEAVELARTLDRLPARLIVYGVAGSIFDVGAPLSPEVGAVIDEVVERSVRERDA